MDGEFDKVKDYVPLDTNTNIEHMSEIEWIIRHINNRCHSITADLKYRHFPVFLIKHLVKFAVMFMSTFPYKQGVSDEISSRDIVLRWQLS
jgi:hypothetical protein